MDIYRFQSCKTRITQYILKLTLETKSNDLHSLNKTQKLSQTKSSCLQAKHSTEIASFPWVSFFRIPFFLATTHFHAQKKENPKQQQRVTGEKLFTFQINHKAWTVCLSLSALLGSPCVEGRRWLNSASNLCNKEETQWKCAHSPNRRLQKRKQKAEG